MGLLRNFLHFVEFIYIGSYFFVSYFDILFVKAI